MQVSKKDLEKSQIELSVELSLEEFKVYIDKGVEKVAKDMKIEGFRPGKAPHDVVKQKVGEMAILEEASRFAINSTIDEAIEKNTSKERQAIGQPQVNVTKLAPDNPFLYKVILSVLPEITLGEYKGFDIKIEETKVDEKEIDKAIEDLREMRATEAAVSRGVENGDKVMLDINMLLNKVPLEESGGKDLAVMVGKDFFVPGFDKNILGAKKGEEKKFQVEYPADHHKKNLAGKNVDFEIKVKEVFERKLPELDDKFAEMFKIKNLEELKNGIKDNLTLEKKKHSDGKNEMTMFEKVVEGSKFGELPEAIIDSEAKNMMAELERSVTSQGGKFDDYLSHLKKTSAELMLEMTPSAVKRVKTALIIRVISEKENIVPTEKEIDAKVAELKKTYEANADVMKMLEEPGYRNYLNNILTNEKVLSKLKEWNYASTGSK